MNVFKVLLYSLAILTCFACTMLLFRGYAKKRLKLLMWSAVCFAGLTVNNVLLFVDLVIFPTVDLRPARLVVALVSMLFLLYAFIWEAE